MSLLNSSSAVACVHDGMHRAAGALRWLVMSSTSCAKERRTNSVYHLFLQVCESNSDCGSCHDAWTLCLCVTS